MSLSGFHFGTPSIEKEISQQKRDDDPFDYWADIRGFYRTTILTVDYSGAFSGLLLFATSRLRPGAKSLNALYLLPMMMVRILNSVEYLARSHDDDSSP
ncbi:hypothetical protein TELCIR_19348 [Teladorsagia circumcincta]|uniref:Uncharacterized protein n=1 Tax=Teladorsagia circumcincta TaxID=45464 RepID=A0A2G9TMR2_TELCI|nr:hypothetical protein TELCIR_19348 [Teladorsagia circumcincta]